VPDLQIAEFIVTIIAGVFEKFAIHRPFAIEIILSCNVESACDLEIDHPVDAGMKSKILSGDLSCFECHAAPHPRKKL